MGFTGMTQCYVALIRNRVKVGDEVMWEDAEHYVPPKGTEPITARVIRKYPSFCVTDKGSVQWGVLAGYAWKKAGLEVKV